jgi:post-segregation antitoxin (ccd killing protein)
MRKERGFRHIERASAEKKHRPRTIVRAKQETRWLAENRAAIDAYNQRISRHGLLTDETGQ